MSPHNRSAAWKKKMLVIVNAAHTEPWNTRKLKGRIFRHRPVFIQVIIMEIQPKWTTILACSFYVFFFKLGPFKTGITILLVGDDADLAEDETGPMPLTNAVPVCNSLVSSFGYLRISSPWAGEQNGLKKYLEVAVSSWHDWNVDGGYGSTYGTN